MEDINEMRLIRREKLQNLIESGKNPYVHEKFEGRIQSQKIKNECRLFLRIGRKNVTGIDA